MILFIEINLDHIVPLMFIMYYKRKFNNDIKL